METSRDEEENEAGEEEDQEVVQSSQGVDDLAIEYPDLEFEDAVMLEMDQKNMDKQMRLHFLFNQLQQLWEEVNSFL